MLASYPTSMPRTDAASVGPGSSWWTVSVGSSGERTGRLTMPACGREFTRPVTLDSAKVPGNSGTRMRTGSTSGWFCRADKRALAKLWPDAVKRTGLRPATGVTLRLEEEDLAYISTELRRRAVVFSVRESATSGRPQGRT